jgi:2'-5' RNA ligase
METIRTFVAIELNREIQNRLSQLQEKLNTANADVKWVGGEKIHLTLKFLGNIATTQLEQVNAVVIKVLDGWQPFKLAFGGVGAFPNLRVPRVIWVGVVKGQEELIKLAKGLEEEFTQYNFPLENRSFSPHLTLGRIRSPRGRGQLVELLRNADASDLGSQKVEKVIIFRSDLRPEGPIYTPLRMVWIGLPPQPLG